MAVLGTADGCGRVWASVVTGAPGFIRVVDDRTLRMTTRPVSSDPLFNNLAREHHVALFAPDFVTPRRLRVNGLGVIKDGQIYIRTEEVYGNCRRYMQERILLGPRPITRGGETGAAQGSVLSEHQQAQISRADTFFIATDHPKHGADVSHKGGKPGFVRIIDSRRIAFPDYNGNRMFNTLGNIVVNPKAGLLFIDFDGGRTLQLSGSASIDWEAERLRSFAGAERIVDFELAEIIDNPFGFPLQSRFRQFSRFNP
jgi:predicted pyridoxine 5'-phosphate oxidase superfamily flavin-nucleotide-binding protein